MGWGGVGIVRASLDRLTLVCHPNEGFITIINFFTMLVPSLVTQPPPFF